MSKYILEACLVSYELAHIPPSKMAASSLLLSLKLHTPENEMKKLWNANLTYYSGYDLDSLKYTVARVADVVKDAHIHTAEPPLVIIIAASNVEETIELSHRGSLSLDIHLWHLLRY